MQKNLQQLCGEAQAILQDKYVLFLQRLQVMSPQGGLEVTPMDFNLRAWSAYLECIQEPGYFFSVDEQVAMCAVAQINIACFKQIDSNLFFAYGYFAAEGPVTCCKLSSNGSASVRSHFEGMVRESTIQILMHVVDTQRNFEDVR